MMLYVKYLIEHLSEWRWAGGTAGSREVVVLCWLGAGYQKGMMPYRSYLIRLKARLATLLGLEFIVRQLVSDSIICDKCSKQIR